MSAQNVTNLRPEAVRCTNCDASIAVKESYVSVVVSVEKFETPDFVDVQEAQALHVLCARCTPLFDLQKVRLVPAQKPQPTHPGAPSKPV